MAGLEVDTTALRTAADRSEKLASSLTTQSVGGQGSGESAGGVAAVNSAIAAARTSQATTINDHAATLRAGANGYDSTDGGSAHSISGTIDL